MAYVVKMRRRGGKLVGVVGPFTTKALASEQARLFKDNVAQGVKVTVEAMTPRVPRPRKNGMASYKGVPYVTKAGVWTLMEDPQTGARASISFTGVGAEKKLRAYVDEALGSSSQRAVANPRKARSSRKARNPSAQALIAQALAPFVIRKRIEAPDVKWIARMLGVPQTEVRRMADQLIGTSATSVSSAGAKANPRASTALLDGVRAARFLAEHGQSLDVFTAAARYGYHPGKRKEFNDFVEGFENWTGEGKTISRLRGPGPIRNSQKKK